MATISLQELNETGIASLTFTACEEDGDVFNNSGNQFIVLKNDDSETSVTLTITAQKATVNSPLYGTLSKANATLVVVAGRLGYIGPFKAPSFNNGDGNVEFTCSVVDDISVAIVTLATGTI